MNSAHREARSSTLRLTAWRRFSGETRVAPAEGRSNANAGRCPGSTGAGRCLRSPERAWRRPGCRELRWLLECPRPPESRSGVGGAGTRGENQVRRLRGAWRGRAAHPPEPVSCLRCSPVAPTVRLLAGCSTACEVQVRAWAQAKCTDFLCTGPPQSRVRRAALRSRTNRRLPRRCHDVAAVGSRRSGVTAGSG